MSRFYFTPVFLALMVLAGKLQAQSRVYICGKVTEEGGAAVAACEVKLKNTEKHTLSDKNGRFCFSESFKKGEIIRITVPDARYQVFQQDFTVVPNNAGKDTMYLSLVLEPIVLKEVNIEPDLKEVYKSDKLNVLDFDFVGDKLLLLTYEKRPGNNMRLVLADEHNQELAAYIVNDDVTQLERDYQGKIRLTGEAVVFDVNVYDDKIYLLKGNSEEYEKYLKPLVAQANDHIYFSNYVWSYPGFSYYAYQTTDSSYKTLRYVEDKFMMDLYRAEYKYVDTRTKLEAYRMELRTGVDKEIWAAAWNDFPHSLYYKPVYVPMFVRNDSVMIFDHYSNHLFYYDETNALLDSVEINYHLGKEHGQWKKRMMMDDVSKKIYNLFEKNGTYMLVELDNRARPVRSFSITHKYPEKIKVHNGYIYYNYRPFESLQNKYLYRQVAF